MLRVLLIAPTCDRDDVGEAWVAYQWASRLSRLHDVTLLTYHKRGRQPAADQLPGVRVVEWREPPLVGKAERLNSMLKPAYIPFYIRAKRWIARAQARGERFDVGHQPTPVAMRYPSPLATSGIPYIMGPVGGSLDSPPGFDSDDTAPWFVGLRSLDRYRLAHDPVLRRTYRQASCVVGIAPYVRDNLQTIMLQRFEIVSDTGIANLPPPVDRSDRSGTVRLLFVGRLVRTKGARDVIRALDDLRDLSVSLDIVGEGYDRTACMELAASLGVQDRVVFRGRVPREQVDDFYRDADIFVFPSYREAGGSVVAEAMSHGLPMVVCSRGGPGSTVDDTCGMRIDPITPEQYAHDIAKAIRDLVTSPSHRRSLGDNARNRAEAIRSWSAMVGRVSELYLQLAEASH